MKNVIECEIICSSLRVNTQVTSEINMAKEIETQVYDADGAIDRIATALRDGSEIKKSGVREIPKALMVGQLKDLGVSEEEVKRVQEAMGTLTTAASEAALRDNMDKFNAASADDKASETFRRNLSSEVRIPTFGGSTTVENFFETVKNNPFKKADEGAVEPEVVYGRTSVKVNTKMRIAPGFHKHASDTILAAVGETVD